jgi:hypothetical protein
MVRPALLEINVSRRDEHTCGIDLRFERPGDALAAKLSSADVPLDLRSLRGHRHDRDAYGQALARSLLASKDLATTLNDALSHPDVLRIRLHVNRSSSALHAVRWETLADPSDFSRWLLTNQRLLFSRYVSPDRRPSVRFRDVATLRVLIVVANPPQLATQVYEDGGRRLEPIVVEEEVARLTTALRPLVPEIMVTSPVQADSTSVRRIVARLRGDYDVLCLVCHGALISSDPQVGPEPVLFVGSDDGRSAVALGSSFIAALSDLPELPRLIVLVSCQSADTGEQTRNEESSRPAPSVRHVDTAGDYQLNDVDGLVALAPGLARIGVPAVLGMQGRVSMKTMSTFLPLFFTELMKDGQIDRAVASARGAVRAEPDAWMPTLYLQAKEGRLWAAPGAHAALGGFQQWRELIEGIADPDQTAIAVLGTGLFDAALVPQQHIARQWAKAEGLPFVEHGRDDLPHVAQYVATMNKPEQLRDRWRDTLLAELRARYPDVVPAGTTRLKDVVAKIAAKQRDAGSNTPHLVLARLPFKIYVVTSPDNLLAQALEAEGRAPVVEFFRWNTRLEAAPSILDENRLYRPTTQQPLVYHLLGNLDVPASLVLTEDHYLEYLMRVQSRETTDQFITKVEAALKNQPLLLVGFQFDDWDFRVLFRSIGAGQRARQADVGAPSVAVQITPDDERFLQPTLVQSYLEKYFGSANLNVSWGSPDAFLNELWRQWLAFGAARRG